MGAWQVEAPYVTLKVKDFNGATVVQGYYLGGVVNDPIEDAQFEKHVRTGLIKEFVPPEPDAPAEPDGPPVDEPPVFERPAGNASQEAWATYALESGQASEDEVKGLTRDELRELYG